MLTVITQDILTPSMSIITLRSTFNAGKSMMDEMIKFTFKHDRDIYIYERLRQN